MPQIQDTLGDSGNVLFLAPTMDPKDKEGCGTLVSIGDPADTAFLSVSLSEGPDDRLDVWRTHGPGDLPGKRAFITVGEQTRSVGFEDHESAMGDADAARLIETVSSPADLTGIGMKVSDILSGWSGDVSQIVLCFHSLTILLQYVDLQKAFRFLHVLTNRMDSVGAFAHYHLDPTVVEKRDINTLTTLFDAVIELDDNDEWTVRTR